MEYIALDCPKRYTYAVVEDERGRVKREGKIPHEQGAFPAFLAYCEPGSPVAVETVGNGYWIVDEIEHAGCQPRFVHAAKAKLMRGMTHKTDKLDARGLNKLQRSGTLPELWIPPADLRDKRELCRARMVWVKQRTQLKQRVLATLAKYDISVSEVSDIFGVEGRKVLAQKLPELPPPTREVTEVMLAEVEALREKIEVLEKKLQEVLSPTKEMEWVDSLPGVGFILAVVIVLEVGTVERFPGLENLASYAGLVPRVQASGGRVRHGKTRADVSYYLKWAFVEAANVIARHAESQPYRHVASLPSA